MSGVVNVGVVNVAQSQKCRYIDNGYGLLNTPSQVSNLSRKPVAYFHENLKTP